MGSVLIPTVNKPTEGPCRLLKNVRWGILLPLDVVSKKGTNSPDPRIPRLHLCHMHSIMHSSIPPMRYRSFDLHQLLSHFSKHGNKSNRQEVLPSQGQKPRYHQHQGIRAVDGTPPNASLPQDLRKDLRVDHSRSVHRSHCITHPILRPAFEMLHVRRLPIGTNH